MIWLAVCAALVAGLAAGWLLHSTRSDAGRASDWKTRLAARDRDLVETQRKLADVSVELQESRALLDRYRSEGRAGGTPGADLPEEAITRERARADELAERLRAAEAEIADLQDLEGAGTASGDPALVQRIEHLEVELASAASMQCPDPAAHGRLSETEYRRPPRRAGLPAGDVGSSSPVAAVPAEAPAGQGDQAAYSDRETDDLTAINGIGTGIARVLTTMGIASYKDLAEIDEATLDRLEDAMSGTRRRFERYGWAAAARAHHARKYGPTS